jgi:hemolysin activation/secretion protein
LRVYAGSGQTTPTGPLSQEGYLGTTTVFGTVLTYPVIRSRSQTLNLFGDLDAIDSTVSVVANGARSQASQDSLRVSRAGGDYALSDLLLGADRPGVNDMSARLSQGLLGLGATADGVSTLPRPGEATDFTKFDARLSRTQTLFSPFAGASVALQGVLAGQFTNDTLPPAEEFYLGGLQYGRGYQAGELSGDRALAATAELQFDTSVDLENLGLADPLPLQLYAFYDWGEVWQHSRQSLAGHLASTGLGARLTATSHAEIDLLGAALLNRYPTGAGTNVSPLPGGTFLWRVLARF